MTSTLLALLLASSPATYGAQPNAFEPKEISSEAIYVGMSACIERSIKEDPSSPLQEVIIACGCLTDAIRLNTRNGLRQPANSATPEQAGKCLDVVKKTRAARKTGKAGT